MIPGAMWALFTMLWACMLSVTAMIVILVVGYPPGILFDRPDIGAQVLGLLAFLSIVFGTYTTAKVGA